MFIVIMFLKIWFNWNCCIIILLTNCLCVISQLVVNVNNKGGDLFKEIINANTTQDTVTLELNTADGTHLLLFIDMKNVSDLDTIYITFREYQYHNLAINYSP